MNTNDTQESATVARSSLAGFSPTTFALGMVGAIVGGGLGFFIFDWALGQGFYALAVPGALLGLGFHLAGRQSHLIYGIVCGVLALALSLFAEWFTAPFKADNTFAYFLSHAHELKPMTWIMIVIGTVIGFTSGRGRG